MKIDDIRNKLVSIKCATKDEMAKVVSYLDNHVPWAFREGLYKLDSFESGFIFIMISSSGGYNNYKGQSITIVNQSQKIMAKDFFEKNNIN